MGDQGRRTIVKQEILPLIPPWDAIKDEVSRIVAKFISTDSGAPSLLPAIATTSHESLTDSRDSVGESSVSGYQMAIPHGFQNISSLSHASTNLDSVLYIPGNRKVRIASKDNHYVQLFEGERLLARYDTLKSKGDISGASLLGLSHWICIEKWSAVVISNSKLELKILNSELHETSSIIFGTPILHLNAVSERNELIICTVGKIVYWEMAPDHRRGLQCYRFIKQSMEINDFDSDQWISFTVIAIKSGYLFAVYENTVRIFNYRTGERLETLSRLHEATISALVYIDALGLCITGSRDSSIKIWNSTRNLLLELSGHTDEITALILSPNTVSAPGEIPGTPFLFSSSIDGTIRQWNVDSGTCMYILDTGEPSLGIQFVGSGNLLSLSPNCVNTWDLNGFYKTFYHCRQAVVSLSRHSWSKAPNRILLTTSDGSIRLFSPTNANLLSLAYPTLSTSTVEDTVYDAMNNSLFTFLKDGTIVEYDMKTNPSLIKCENPFPEGAEVLTCQRGLYYQDQFMILAGTNAGQLLCINPDNLKKRSMILQAHAAPIQHLHVSKHNSMLFTSDNNTLKIWDIRFREPGKKVQGLENPPQTPSTLSLELVTMKETSSLFSNVMAVDEAQKTIAIASKDARIAFYSFGNNRISQIRQRGQENHTSNVTAIDANEKLGLFASSSSDGSVKIWKNARLIREMQFGGIVHSCLFVNERGDILVALSDQVALVRFQDYLPPSVLQEILAIDTWSDDVEETAKGFDSEIDVWGVYTAKPTTSSDNRVKDTESRSSIASNLNLEPVDDSDTEHGTLQITLSSENIESSPYMRRVSSHARASSDTPNSIYRRSTPSTPRPTTVMDDYQVKNLPSISHDDLQRRKIKEHTNQIDMCRRSITLDKFKEIMSKVNEESLAEPPKPRARRSTIIRGAPLPNSVLTGQLKEELEQASNRIHVIQERRTQIMLEQKRLKEKYASLDVTPEIEEVDEQPESEDEKELLFIAGEHAEPEKAKQRKTKPRSSLKKKPKTKKKSGQKDSSDGEPPSDVSKEDDTTQQPAGVVPVALPVIQEIVLLVAAPVVESVDYVKSTPSLHPLPITTPESVKESTEPVIAEQPIQEPPIHPAVSQEQLEPVAPEEAKRTLLASRDRDMLLKKFRAQRAELPAQEPVMSPKLDKTFTGGVKKQDIFIKQSTLRQISKGVKPLQEPKARQVKENSMIKQQSVNLEPELSAPVFIDREEELSSEEIEIDPELEIYNPKKPWGLFSHSPNQIPSMSPHDLLKNISKKPWFPGIPKDQQISLGSVIGVLSQINDMWEARAKLEASICLANIYQVFKDDLKGHLDILIEAQLNLMNDESAQVRSIATSMLPTYNKPNDTVKAALISKLADPSEVVRQSARIGLLKIGISSKEEIRNTMVSLHMIKESKPAHKSTYLDTLYREALVSKQRRVQAKNSEIIRWLRGIHPDAFGKTFIRQASPLTTLVFPVAKPEEKGRKIKTKAWKLKTVLH